MLSTLRALAVFILASCSLAAAPGGIPVTITAYNAAPGQTDADPGTSACGPNRPNQIALSRDLFRKVYHCGDRVRLYRPDTGRWHTYVVWDTMAPRKQRSVDILMPTRDQAMQFGKRSGRLAAQ